MVIPLVPRSPARASRRARSTTSVAVVSEVVSARMTSISAIRRSVLRYASRKSGYLARAAGRSLYSIE